MNELSVSASVGLGLLIAVVLWCQLHLASVFQNMDKLGSLRGQSERESEFLHQQTADLYAGCGECCVSSWGWKVGDPCPHCSAPMTSHRDALKHAKESGYVG